MESAGAAGANAPPAHAIASEGLIDRPGHIEGRGIDYVPKKERHSHARNLAWAMFGPQFGFGNMVFGSLLIAFGLSWWSSVVAITIGAFVGAIIFSGVCIQAPRTGTNNAVSSGAFFGVTGRYLGAAISLFIGLGFFAILVWTAGQTIVVVFDRAFGSGTSDTALGIAMAVVCLISFAGAIYGHGTLLASFKFIAFSSAGVSILAVFVLINKFHAVHGGNYLLGGFWATWVLGLVIAASIPISWGPFIGDYGRYVPDTDSSWVPALWGFFGIFAGTWLSEMIGAYATACFKDISTPFATGFTQIAPMWLAVLLMIAPGGLANIESCAMSIYNAALDLHALLWRVTRPVLTFLMSIAGLAVAYIALLQYNAINSIEAFVTIMLVTVTPWMVIMTIGHIVRGGKYFTLDLQAFAVKGRRGVYWFWNGINPRAFLAWCAGTALGLLFAETSIYTGPLPPHVSNVDLSFVSSGALGGIVYLLFIWLFPEKDVVVPPEGEPLPAAALGMAE
jgi:purine-cytosine permease-like protein